MSDNRVRSLLSPGQCSLWSQWAAARLLAYCSCFCKRCTTMHQNGLLHGMPRKLIS